MQVKNKKLVPLSAEITISVALSRKKTLVTDNPPFFQCVAMNYWYTLGVSAQAYSDIFKVQLLLKSALKSQTYLDSTSLQSINAIVIPILIIQQWAYCWEYCDKMSCLRTFETKGGVGIKPPIIWLAYEHETAASTPRFHCTVRNLSNGDVRALVTVRPAEKLSVFTVSLQAWKTVSCHSFLKFVH